MHYLNVSDGIPPPSSALRPEQLDHLVSPQELTVPGQDKPVTVEILSGPAGELEVHQVVAGLLGGQLTVEMVLVTGAGPLAPDQLLCPPHPEVHLVTVTRPLSERHQNPGGDAGRCRLATDHRNQHQRYFIQI